MLLYKCEECGLLTSEEFFECPKCKSERKKLLIDTSEDNVFVICREDVENVLEEAFSEEEREKILSEHSMDTIVAYTKRKIELPWFEDIECFIRCRFLD